MTLIIQHLTGVDDALSISTVLPIAVKTKRGRKMKQTSIIDLFGTSKNTVPIDNPEAEDIPESNECTNNDDAATNSNRISVIISPAKSSRYGRIIKPKSYEIDSEPSKKKRKVERIPQITSQDEQEQTNITKPDEDSLIIQSSEAVHESAAVLETPVKKRGRPKKIRVAPLLTVSDQQKEVESTEADEQPNGPCRTQEIVSTVTASRNRRSGRVAASINTSTNSQVDDDLISSSQHTTSTESPVKKREPKLIRKKNMIRSTTIPSEPESYTCGYCNERIPHPKWKAHVGKHYGAAWRIGVDEAIDISDNLTMTRVLNRFMKSSKMQYFKCDKCLEKKRSALGYISHIEICGLTPEQIVGMKSECPYCKKLYRKVSLDIHIQQFCAVRRLELAAQDSDALALVQPATGTADQPVEPVEYSASGRPKRTLKSTRTNRRNIDEFIKIGNKVTGGVTKHWTSALQTDNIIKCPNVDCDFSAMDVGQMRMHHRDCRSKLLQCRLCLAYFNGRDDIVRHIESQHSKDLEVTGLDESESGEDDDDYNAEDQSSSSDDDAASHGDASDFDEQNNRSRRKETRSGKRNKTITLTRVLEEDAPEFWEMIKLLFGRMITTQIGFFKMAYTWTKEYINTNFDQSALVLSDHISITDTNYKYITQSEHDSCTTALDQRSMPFMCQRQTDYSIETKLPSEPKWDRLDLFGASMIGSGPAKSSIVFCGGRITSMHWIPYPSTYTGSQTLIVCTQNKNAPLTSATNHLPIAHSFGSLIQLWRIETDAENNASARFIYGIDYTDGLIASMALCPSDAYIPSKRLAIAAIPDRCGNINISSLPDIDCSETKNIVRLKTQVKLQLGFNNDEEPARTVTQLTWSRLKGHGLLCAGFNTGLVAIWNFDHLNSSYLCRRNATDNVSVLLPHKVFQAALTSITHLDMHAGNETCIRWLLVGSLERKMRMYDLNDCQLVPFVSPVFKSRILAGAWPVHWPVYLVMVDAAWTRLGGGLHIKQILYTNNQPQSASLYLDSHPSNVSFSDWMNSAIFGNDVGDVFMVNFHQMLAHDRSGISSEMKILSSAHIHISANEPTNDDTVHIVFNEFDEYPTASRNQTRVLAPDHNLLSKINRIECNPNESHHRLYAIGYDIGFCRIESVYQPRST